MVYRCLLSVSCSTRTCGILMVAGCWISEKRSTTPCLEQRKIKTGVYCATQLLISHARPTPSSSSPLFWRAVSTICSLRPAAYVTSPWQEKSRHHGNLSASGLHPPHPQPPAPKQTLVCQSSSLPNPTPLRAASFCYPKKG